MAQPAYRYEQPVAAPQAGIGESQRGVEGGVVTLAASAVAIAAIVLWRRSALQGTR